MKVLLVFTACLVAIYGCGIPIYRRNRVIGGIEASPGLHKRSDHTYLQKIHVSKLTQHPDYYLFHNDISIIKLSRPAMLNTRVQPACLPNAEESPAVGAECYLTGWGVTSFGQDGDAIHISSAVDTLRQVKLKVLPHSTCKKNKWAKIIGLIVTKKMLCAGYGPSARRGACAGDQGGPLVCRRGSGSEEWVLQGVMSR